MNVLKDVTIYELEAQRDALYLRLENGYDFILKQEEKSEDTQEAEKYWNELYRVYEAVIEEIRRRL